MYRTARTDPAARLVDYPYAATVSPWDVLVPGKDVVLHTRSAYEDGSPVPVRLAVTLALAAVSAASVLSARSPSPSTGTDAADTPFRAKLWRPLFEGVEVAEFVATAPRPVRGVAVRIDLTAPGVEFLANPGNGGRGGETDGRKVSTFLREFRLTAAPCSQNFSRSS